MRTIVLIAAGFIAGFIAPMIAEARTRKRPA
jgi:hypothetical protein